MSSARRRRVGAALALLYGVPLALVGFGVGVGTRRVARVIGGGAGPHSWTNRT